MGNTMAEYAVVASGLKDSVQRSLFAVILESPGTSGFLDRRWVSAKRQQYVGYPIGYEERVKECMQLSTSLFLI